MSSPKQRVPKERDRKGWNRKRMTKNKDRNGLCYCNLSLIQLSTSASKGKWPLKNDHILLIFFSRSIYTTWKHKIKKYLGKPHLLLAIYNISNWRIKRMFWSPGPKYLWLRINSSLTKQQRTVTKLITIFKQVLLT